MESKEPPATRLAVAELRGERLANAQGTTVRALAMRDTDCDLTSVMIVRADGPVADPVGATRVLTETPA